MESIGIASGALPNIIDKKMCVTIFFVSGTFFVSCVVIKKKNEKKCIAYDCISLGNKIYQIRVYLHLENYAFPEPGSYEKIFMFYYVESPLKLFERYK